MSCFVSVRCEWPNDRLSVGRQFAPKIQPKLLSVPFTDTLPSCFCGPYGPVTGLGMKHTGWVCGLAQMPLPKSIAFDRVTSECSYTRPTPTENRSLRSSEAASVRSMTLDRKSTRLNSSH